jgi:hypothetical protein
MKTHSIQLSSRAEKRLQHCAAKYRLNPEDIILGFAEYMLADLFQSSSDGAGHDEDIEPGFMEEFRALTAGEDVYGDKWAAKPRVLIPLTKTNQRAAAAPKTKTPRKVTSSTLCNATQLAEAMSVPKGFVTAMRNAGYEFQYGHQTTLKHALAWRADHPEFKPSEHRRNPKTPKKESPAKLKLMRG